MWWKSKVICLQFSVFRESVTITKLVSSKYIIKALKALQTYMSTVSAESVQGILWNSCNSITQRILFNHSGEMSTYLSRATDLILVLNKNSSRLWTLLLTFKIGPNKSVVFNVLGYPEIIVKGFELYCLFCNPLTRFHYTSIILKTIRRAVQWESFRNIVKMKKAVLVLALCLSAMLIAPEVTAYGKNFFHFLLSQTLQK